MSFARPPQLVQLAALKMARLPCAWEAGLESVVGRWGL